MTAWTKPIHKKTLISNFWFVEEFVGNKFTAEFTDEQSTQKKKYPLHSLVFFSRSLPYNQ